MTFHSVCMYVHVILLHCFASLVFTFSRNYIVEKRKKGILFEFACFVFTKVLIEDNTFTSPTGDRTDILHGHPSHVKV